ncbi:hypothetical protein SAMN04515674_104268 [Pseudarcicella hirudinis]|uniref:Uncharacterized protein n=1 Tax=Pseudarcicella hirudinis TaxID=1079859 RepID=A0A1I5RWY8_9BACT|nr:hypothetical protein [Pseudarcicella hirudinis]SFP62506.1 hypothetical protein SAMN04515674_104268 [Pseudarcicella hirudinis]
MNPKGNVWWIGGKKDTGKSFEALKIAEYFRKREVNPKRTIIFDHTFNNSTYHGIQIIDIKDLDYVLPKKASVRVQTTDWRLFIEKCFKIKNAVIIFDDVTAIFRGNIPDVLLTLCGKAKNERLEIMFQFHTINETAPSLIRASDMMVIKQTLDSLPVKSSCRENVLISHIIQDCRTENKSLPEKKKYATRLLDTVDDKIYIKKLGEEKFENSYIDFIEIDDYKMEKGISKTL